MASRNPERKINAWSTILQESPRCRANKIQMRTRKTKRLRWWIESLISDTHQSPVPWTTFKTSGLDLCKARAVPKNKLTMVTSTIDLVLKEANSYPRRSFKKSMVTRIWHSNWENTSKINLICNATICRVVTKILWIKWLITILWTVKETRTPLSVASPIWWETITLNQAKI